MDSSSSSKLHPALWVAAIAVTAFSAVGIAALTGFLPRHTEPAPTTEPAAAAPATPVATPAPLPPAPQGVAEKPVEKASTKPVAKQTATTYSSRPRRIEEDRDDVYRSDSGRYPADRGYSSQQEPGYTSQSQVCRTCGIVESVNVISEKGEGSGLGAIAGGVVGGIVGNQIGRGDGRDVARILGMAGGAYAGNQIEKSQRGRSYYDITVRLDDGSMRKFRQESQPAWQPGDRVRVEDGTIIPR